MIKQHKTKSNILKSSNNVPHFFYIFSAQRLSIVIKVLGTNNVEHEKFKKLNFSGWRGGGAERMLVVCSLNFN